MLFSHNYLFYVQILVIILFKAQPGPAQGSEPGRAQGSEPGPAQGSEPGPAQGSELGRAQGSEPGRAQGSAPGPAQGSEPGPAHLDYLITMPGAAQPGSRVTWLVQTFTKIHDLPVKQ